jgi:ABC-type dipeptide/oligopeptide/nickel transport system ATPase component
MMQGEIVETGPVKQVLFNPAHAYTKKLVALVLLLRAGKRGMKQ